MFRSQQFVQERFGNIAVLDVKTIFANITNTRFPVPEGEVTDTRSDPALIRSADLIGQLAHTGYLVELAALFGELAETGATKALGYNHPDDLRMSYPKFFWQLVAPLIQGALNYLEITQEGKQWTANLFAHVFIEEHGGRRRRARRAS